MHLLLSNDDGYRAPGLAALAEALAALGEITVMAPDRNRSGASNSLTLEQPIRVDQAQNGFFFVDGTPTDCVHLALTGFLQHEPDIVVSGINEGANMGDDVIYSGTVAAAMEGRFLGLPSIAISLVLDQGRYYSTAARVAASLVRRMAGISLPPNTLLNVNVPDIAYADIRGLKVTRLGNRHKAEPAIRSTDPRGRPIYWVGPPGDEQDAGPGTDFHAVREGYVSITPISVDLTYAHAMEPTSQWATEINLHD